jgi:hypothetical protein
MSKTVDLFLSGAREEKARGRKQKNHAKAQRRKGRQHKAGETL